MTHECDDCGAGFDTLSRLRMHDCADYRETDAPGDAATDQSGGEAVDDGIDREALEREHPDVVGDLPRLVADARDGDSSSLFQALAEYERALTTVANGDRSGGDLHADLQFAYYEPLAKALDAAVQREGWDVLVDVVDAYDPRAEGALPEVGHVVANAVGRAVIRTRRETGVDAVPVDALAFLGAIPEYVDEVHVAYEESYTYGWGIDHPDHSVADRLHALATDEPRFVKIALNTAFYVDQHAALAVFETLVTDDDVASDTRRTPVSTTDLTEFYFRAVADLQTEQLLGPHAPPYWEGDDDLPRVVDLDPAVTRRIRELAAETGVADGLPADWSLQDLDSSLVSDLL